MLTLKNIDRIFFLLFSKVPLRLSVSSAMGEDLTSLHAFRYADKVARYVCAWYGIGPPLSVPLGTAWVSASSSCVPNGTPWVGLRLSRHCVPGYPLAYLTARYPGTYPPRPFPTLAFSSAADLFDVPVKGEGVNG